MVQIDAWSFYESLGESDRSNLTPLEQAVAAVCDLRQEVNSGGFDAYFRYWGGDTASIALSGIGSLLGPEWALLLSEAMSLLGETYPQEQERREDLLDSLELDQQLDACDTRFYELEALTDSDEKLNAALTAADA